MFVGMRRENNFTVVWVRGEGKEVVDTFAQSPGPTSESSSPYCDCVSPYRTVAPSM